MECGKYHMTVTESQNGHMTVMSHIITSHSHSMWHRSQLTGMRTVGDKMHSHNSNCIYSVVKSNGDSIEFSLSIAEQRAVGFILAWSLASLQAPSPRADWTPECLRTHHQHYPHRPDSPMTTTHSTHDQPCPCSNCYSTSNTCTSPSCQSSSPYPSCSV